MHLFSCACSHRLLHIDSVYRRRYHPSNMVDDQSGGEFNGLNRHEANARVRAEQEYLHNVIDKHQQSSQPEASPQHHDALQQIKDESIGAVVVVQLSNNTSHTYPVQPLIAYCETATRMVTWRKRCGEKGGFIAKSNGSATERLDTSTTSSSEAEEKENHPIMELSLVEFDADATISFIEVLVSLHDHDQTRAADTAVPKPQDMSTPISRKRQMNYDMDEELSKQQLISLIDDGMIPAIHIVECLKIAHYLQCRIVFDTLASILEHSIDSHNCMSICSLADAMNLKSLFEASANFVIERLDSFQGTAVASEAGEETQSSCSSSCDDVDGKEGFNEVWTSLPYDLRSRVLTMRNVMRSSVIGRGSKVSGLFFSSASEFLAIFRETIRDQEERLSEAKKRSDEVIRERREEWAAICQRRGPWFDRSVKASNEFVYGADVLYSLEKIEKQSRRLNTLRSFYEDQKIIFRGGGFESEIIL